MCYMNCKYENNSGGCRKPITASCPADWDEDSEVDLKDEYEAAMIEKYESRKADEEMIRRG